MRSSNHERVIAVAAGTVTAVYLALASQYQFGTPGRPGPGFFPVAIGFLGLALAVTTALGARGTARLSLGFPAAILLAALVAFGLLVGTLGFILAGGLFTALMVRLLGSRNPWQIIITGMLAPVCLYLIFVRGFRIRLPEGIVEWMLSSMI